MPSTYDYMCEALWRNGPRHLIKEVGENRAGKPTRPARALSRLEAIGYVNAFLWAYNWEQAEEIYNMLLGPLEDPQPVFMPPYQVERDDVH